MKPRSPNAIADADKDADVAAVARGEAAERERVRQALHDGLGQLLTSISFLAGSLRQKLAARDLSEESDAADILALTTQAINKTQALVHPDGQAPLHSTRVQT